MIRWSIKRTKLSDNHMKKTIKFIYFDVGGVLLDWREGHRRVAKKYNVPYESISKIFDANWQAACRGTLSSDDYMGMFASLLGITGPLPDVSDFWTDYFTKIPQGHQLVQELSETYQLGILSNAEKGAMKHASAKGLIPAISWASLVDSSEHGTIKPEPRIYEIAEQKSGVSPEEIFFIDDVPLHIEIAKARGWQGLVFDTNDATSSVKSIRDVLCI